MGEEVIQNDEVITDENDPTSVSELEPDFNIVDDNEDSLTNAQLEKLKNTNQLSGEEEYVSAGYKIFQKKTRTGPYRGADGILRGHCNTCNEGVEINERGRFNKCSHCGSYDLQS